MKILIYNKSEFSSEWVERRNYIFIYFFLKTEVEITR